MGDDADALIDAIYEAGLMPDRWPDALDRLARAFGARGGLLMIRSGGAEKWTASVALVPVMQDFVDQGWAGHNIRALRCRAAAARPGFVTDRDLMTAYEIDTLPIYTEFLTPRGFGAGAGSAINGIQCDGLMLTLEGFADHDAARSAVPFLDRLRPHLARAAAISARLKLEQAAAATTALASIGTPAAIVAGDARIISANPAFAAWVDEMVGEHDGRLGFFDGPSHRSFMDALATACRGIGRSVAVRKRGETRFVLHLVPATGSARDVFQPDAALAVLDIPGASTVLEPDLIRRLYDLTLAEARVAHLVASGNTPTEAARRLGVSIETVRTHLKQAFAKTGVGRQSALSIQLRSIASRRPG